MSLGLKQSGRLFQRYQESFYDKFKVDLGDPTRFKTMGELVFAIYQTIYEYNHTRIHSALKMSPVAFAELTAPRYDMKNKIRV